MRSTSSSLITVQAQPEAPVWSKSVINRDIFHDPYLGSIVGGLLIAVLLSLGRNVFLLRANHRANRKISKLESQISNLEATLQETLREVNHWIDVNLEVRRQEETAYLILKKVRQAVNALDQKLSTMEQSRQGTEALATPTPVRPLSAAPTNGHERKMRPRPGGSLPPVPPSNLPPNNLPVDYISEIFKVYQDLTRIVFTFERRVAASQRSAQEVVQMRRQMSKLQTRYQQTVDETLSSCSEVFVAKLLTVLRASSTRFETYGQRKNFCQITFLGLDLELVFQDVQSVQSFINVLDFCLERGAEFIQVFVQPERFANRTTSYYTPSGSRIVKLNVRSSGYFHGRNCYRIGVALEQADLDWLRGWNVR
ncbi:LapA family protein [Leptolyngbya sp. FACHB-261]|uniref:LapA family protein n=1 Tax=Leptolyngbya sp. FACHB-261 TaxID=2692806 RepID=UPI00168296B8|nr:LapA family protein [Leptolyngbya sp. FACHB-261]MBD2103783.1 hypothetical protein [Leptolyngbya sp. FACHB-261]